MTKARNSSFSESLSSGKCTRAGTYLGAHLSENGVLFRVWAPNAVRVSLVGDFNNWQIEQNQLADIGGGIWESEVHSFPKHGTYKFAILAKDGQTLWKTDPYGTFTELRPASASIFYELDGYSWSDDKWLDCRRTHKVYHNPLNIYELHLGSWKRHENGEFLTYREAAKELIPYVKSLGFTHIELMPLTEFPYDASWGYQCTGYFAASSRFGTPHDLMYFIDACHKAGLGVIMDWVPAHFPKDPHGLVEFDGCRLYEDSDPLMAEHPSWGTRIFDYAKGEVRSFLISSALFWLEKYHFDGLRVDAVASMLYLDYDRENGNWKRNKFGGRENLNAVEFLKQLNEACFSYDDSILMIAEESTAWPLVTAPTDIGGLGFNLKWNMGWMNDSLRYLKTDPYFRAGQHSDLTFSIMYAFSENFVLPLSHDEVVHMKGSLIGKIPGTEEQKFATVRAFWAYMLAHPGKKLLFMGAELGQHSEWDFSSQLPWELLDKPESSSLHLYFKVINSFYKLSKPLWDLDFDGNGFQWICPDESEKNVIAFFRKDSAGKELVFVCNFSGITVNNFRLGVSGKRKIAVIMSTDELRFGGSGSLCKGTCFAVDNTPQHGLLHSIVIDIPPLTAIFLS
ncbi:MAG: 1,4-alpha-glucan branching protein GlgB [Oscillospiraceae bacterium]|nr:1,4-alpha-glucan branching protein GlgB [Oscillospiraceae bacterium]